MNFREAAEIINSATDAYVRRNGVPPPIRRTPAMILADIEASMARTHALIRELRERLPNE